MSVVYISRRTLINYNHSNCLKFFPESRPFENATEMDNTMIERFNSRVGPEDEAYILGDFALKCSNGYLDKILGRLNGRKYLVLGNHDKRLYYNKSSRGVLERHFEWIKDYHELKVNGMHFIMFHFPIELWNKKHYGSFHVNGHSHGKVPRKKGILRMDVGVDTNNLYPYSLDEVVAIMESLKV